MGKPAGRAAGFPESMPGYHESGLVHFFRFAQTRSGMLEAAI